jgi:uncharacterized glyoxalase superfamily protein PhnB
MIKFYTDAFDNATTEIQTYAEMPFVEAYGIKEPELDMVWRATLIIRYGNNAIRFKLSDSLLIARRSTVTCRDQAYNPLICLEHYDEQYVRDLFEKLYSGEYSFEDIQKGIYSDKYGIRWIYKKSDNCSIYHCLEFNGNCREVVEYTKNAYQVNVAQLITYEESQYADKISMDAKDKIYSALIEFEHDDCCYDIKYSDSLDSAIHNLNGYGSDDKLWYQIIITVEDTDEEHLVESFGRLSVGATLNRQISPNEEGYLYGSLIDQYGIVWELMTC